MKILAIIPARSGSKGLKNKNIKEFAGRPLIAHTIGATLKSKNLAKVMVSTDSEDYACIARENGAEVPFLRSQITASDTAKTKSAVIEVLDHYKKNGETYSHVMILQPTSPLRSTDDIDESIELMKRKNAKVIIGVCRDKHPPIWSNTLPQDFCMNNFIDESNALRRQEYDEYYRINGAIYLSEIKYYIDNESLFRDETFAYVMPEERSIDIDTIFDFKIAEFLMLQNKT